MAKLLTFVLFSVALCLAIPAQFDLRPKEPTTKVTRVSEPTVNFEPKPFVPPTIDEGVSKRSTVMTLGVQYSDYVSPQTNFVAEYSVNVPTDGNGKIIITIQANNNLSLTSGYNGYSFFRTDIINPGMTVLEYSIDCSVYSYSFQIIPAYSSYLPVNFTIIATSASNTLTYGSQVSSNDIKFQSVFYSLSLPQVCNSISILVGSPTNSLDGVTLKNSCYNKRDSQETESKRGPNCPFQNLPSVQYPFYSQSLSGIPSSYFLLKVDTQCLASGSVLILRGSPDTLPKPYTIAVSNQTNFQCPNDCNGNGVCFENTCYCQKPWTGANCNVFSNDGITNLAPSFFYQGYTDSDTPTKFLFMNLTQAELNGRNIHLHIHGAANIQMFKRSVLRENTMLNVYAYYPYNESPVYEFCSAGVTGVIILTVSNFGATGYYNISVTFVDRTLTYDVPSYAPRDQSSLPTTYQHLFFRVPNPGNNTIIGTVEGRAISQVALVDVSMCTFWNYRGYGSSGTNFDYGTDKNAYQVSGYASSGSYSNECTGSVVSGSELYLIVDGFASNYTKAVVSNHAGVCPNGCSGVGRCGPDNQCVCLTGFSGSDCSAPTSIQLFVDQPSSFVSSGTDTFIFYNQVDMPFYVAHNSTSSTQINVNRPLTQSYYGNALVTCSSNYTGWWSIQLSTYPSGVQTSIVVRQVDNTVVSGSYQTVLTTETLGSNQPSVSIKYFEVNDYEEVTVEVDFQTSDSSSISFNLEDDSCQNAVTVSPTQTSSGYIAVFHPCTAGKYNFRVTSTNGQISYNYRITRSNGTDVCPQCCSKNGVCNAGVCTCTDGFGGPSCSEQITCNQRPNNICGFTGGFTVNPAIMTQYQSYDCTLNQMIDYLLYAIEAQVPNVTSCNQLNRKTFCDIYFTQCTNTTLSDGCIDSCYDFADQCGCINSLDRASCNLIKEVYFPIYQYFETTPACMLSLTTQQLTTQPLTTQPLTTQPLTTQSLTTQALTTQSMTTQAMTTQPMTTQSMTTQAMTTQSLTTKSLTTRASTTQRLTTRTVTTSVNTPVTTGYSVQARCSTYSFSGQGYFCSADQRGYYQCLEGVYSSQSIYRPCAPGTSCKCAEGVDCGALGLCSI